jgi:hypothetical protein
MWEMVSLDKAELFVGEQLQRVGRQLLRRPTSPKDRNECDHLNWPRFGLLPSRILAPPGW